ncbi:hypothetical protein EW146_g5483 [Bondarzewia mesenterica]|uniref:Glucose-methanol-choline oxidoreductase N-terminal domain-containing protein n=1 Tax=Bondarzewia mesenterica TaxID=1095465 RepID=A0A4S4LSE8_9AGAM|nr:hypothetical protein EW146_g5483 [Bondarzewia mesenterica]
MHSSSVALFGLLLAHTALAKLFTDPAQLPRSEYDFAVVGAGTAGNVIASRLSENPSISACVIEAGGNDAGILEMMISFTAPDVLSNASLIWNYTTIPQKALNNRILPYQRGRVLGGSSSVNFLAYTRGSYDDFDRFANVTGDPGWSWDAVFPFMLKAENFTDPVDHHNITGEFNGSAHGYRGPLLTTLPGFPSSIDPRILASTETDPIVFPFNLDNNAGDTIGIGWLQSTSGLGSRSSSATAYLHPVLHRPNLDVVIQTQVTRLLNVGAQGAVPNCALSSSLKVAQVGMHNRPRMTIRASKEVVLSAGAINTPQLLLLSGIGDPEALSSLGIPILVHSPDSIAGSLVYCDW